MPVYGGVLGRMSPCDVPVRVRLSRHAPCGLGICRFDQPAGCGLDQMLARANATVEQLMAMKKGDFIELERAPKIQAAIDGVPIFECHYGTHNSKYAIRIDKALRGNDRNWLGEKNGI